MVAVYLAGGSHSEYDHIVPVLGIRKGPAQGQAESEADDWILFHTLVTEHPVWKPVRDLGTDRPRCTQGLEVAGNVPRATPFGLVITGIGGDGNRGAPVLLGVDRRTEPDPHRGQAPASLKGTISITGLIPGRTYLIQREDRPPGGAGPTTSFTTRHAFLAVRSTETWTDPTPIPSNGTTRYRCLPGKERP